MIDCIMWGIASLFAHIGALSGLAFALAVLDLDDIKGDGHDL